jgi:phosphatidylglycerophosphatase A
MRERIGPGIINRLSLAYASALYLGFIPGAPGTYGSIAATLAFYLAFLFTGRILPEIHLSAICLISLAGVLTSNTVSRNTGIKDPQFIVIDEVAGQLLTFLFLPVNAFNLILGTILFRLFDMWKPFPIRRLEHLKGGLGVMADDLLAGVYANLVLQLFKRFFSF